MNITLSADEKLLAKARAYAQTHDTTLNQLIRDYLERLTGHLDREHAAEEFARLSRSALGPADPAYRFERKALHERGRGA